MSLTYSLDLDGRPRPRFDERDAEIRDARLAEWDMVDGPRVGDFVATANGATLRFTYDWGDRIQTTVRTPRSGSFYFGGGGWVSFSGSLAAAIAKSRLRLVDGAVAQGRFWFFHHHEVRAFNGVDFDVPCRVYQEINDALP